MNQPKPAIKPLRILVMILLLMLMGMLPLLVSGRWDWWEGWVYFLICILTFVVSRWLMARNTPGLLGERARFGQQEDAKPWDKILAPILAFGGAFILLVAGLDARFNWTVPYAPWIKWVGLALLLAGFALGTYAIVINRFFSGMVRIQTERGHRVIEDGPYRWVRHPGYASGLLTHIGMPLFLNSSWAFIAVVVILALTILRTALEDRTLQAELPGYADYAKRVRHRLLPGIW